jgi:alginate O-acetyltransferase complex protein AlgI
MQFTSLEYVAFFPIAAIACLLATRFRWVAVIATGLVFVLFAGPVHLAVLLGMTVVSYAAGLAIDKWAEQRLGTLLLCLTLAADAGLLCYFKFHGVLAAGVTFAAAHLGLRLPAVATSVFLPIGISYYTFQLIGYVLEIYWGRERAERHFGRLLATIILFPKIVAGPIERPHRLLAQLAAPKPVTSAAAIDGLEQIALGLFKKCVVAERAAVLVDAVYADPRRFTGAPLLVAVFLYGVQIYCDFAGYTDIALGCARILGFELTPNFNAPFSAKSIAEFWRRWHISLSSWTSDYVFRPLSVYLAGTKLFSAVAIPMAIVVSFLVLGVWHGASWTFVAFGLVHGIAVAVTTVTQKRRAAWLRAFPVPVVDRVGNAATVSFYAFSCVLFRAKTVGDATYVLGHAFVGLGSGAGVDLLVRHKDNLEQLALLLLGWAVVRVMRRGLRRVMVERSSAA